jgi:hypothetical protein
MLSALLNQFSIKNTYLTVKFVNIKKISQWLPDLASPALRRDEPFGSEIGSSRSRSMVWSYSK